MTMSSCDAYRRIPNKYSHTQPWTQSSQSTLVVYVPGYMFRYYYALVLHLYGFSVNSHFNVTVSVGIWYVVSGLPKIAALKMRG